MNSDIVKAVQEKLGAAQDNLSRARLSFRGMGPDQMAKEHGQSGQTRASLLADYESDVERWRKALSEATAA